VRKYTYCKIGLFLGIALVVQGSCRKPSAESGGAGQEVVFKATRVDLGPAYAEFSPFRGTFAFSNATDTEIELRAEACCGSRVSFQHDKTVYAPGEEGQIIFEIPGVPNSFHGPIKKQAVVKKDDGKPVAVLTLAADIRRKWRITPTSLNFGPVKPGQTAVIEVEITAGTEEPMRVTGSSTALPTFLGVTKIRETDLNGRLQYRYAISLTGDGRPRPIDTTVSLETTSSTVPHIAIPVKAEMVARIMARPQAVFFGKMPRGATARRELFMATTCGGALTVRSVTSVPNDVRPASFSSADDGVRIDLVFTSPGQMTGVARGVLSIVVDRANEDAEGETKLEVPWVAIIADDQATVSGEDQ
jgi:hypothetical protein